MELYSKGNFMKNLKSLVVLAASFMSVFLMSSCQNSGNNNSNTATMNNVCVTNPAACQSNVYQQGYGFQPYSGYNTGYGQPYGSQGGFYYMNNSAYLCSCPAGSLPTYNSYGGLGCVNNTLLSGGGYAYFGWGTGLSGSTNNQWTNIPQVSNYTGYNNQSSCYNGVVQSCLVDQASTCSSGYTCRATAAQSRLGLCVSNTANNGGTQYSGGYR
jgi:hypothetical protein